MSDKTTKLFGEFPPISSEDWKNKIVADLKGADFDKKLVWRTIEGFDVQPYYRQEDLENLSYLDVKPGQAPFTRGNKRTSNDWFVRQDVKVTDVKAANKKALDILMKGITSVGFAIDDANSYTIADVEALLNDIALEAIEVCFVIKKGKTNFLKLFVEYINKKGIDKKQVSGSINVDFLGNLTLKGAFCYDSEEKCTAFIAEAIEIVKDLPKFKAIEVHADYFQNAGSTISQELAFGLAVGAEYVSKGSEQGVSICKLANAMKFNFAIGSDYFLEIAKFRAAKLLWAKIIEAFNPNCDSNGKDEDICCQKMNIHAVTSTWNKTIYDPYVNMLRTTTEAMSAAIGGVDSLTVLPFNIITGEPTDFSERIARNQQLVLKEESYFDKIVDPAAGSYYIETLTDKVAENAWKLFLEIQDKGGYIAAFKAGYIQDVIAKTQAEREKLIATRRDDLLGVNQFPNFNEIIKEELNLALFDKQSQKADNAIAEPIKICRGAQAFELLRYKTDKYTAKNKRPLAFMLTIGNLTFRKARAQFACNFFACAGFDVLDNNGFETIEEGVAAAKAAGANIVVLCSSDDEYATLAPEAYDKLKGSIFVVAGAPACTDELKAKGITNFVHVKSNVLEELQRYQKELSI
jgi:methylmalonyl-CoA mutase